MGYHGFLRSYELFLHRCLFTFPASSTFAAADFPNTSTNGMTGFAGQAKSENGVTKPATTGRKGSEKGGILDDKGNGDFKDVGSFPAISNQKSRVTNWNPSKNYSYQVQTPEYTKEFVTKYAGSSNNFGIWKITRVICKCVVICYTDRK